jgi:hypothetical protein
MLREVRRCASGFGWSPAAARWVGRNRDLELRADLDGGALARIDARRNGIAPHRRCRQVPTGHRQGGAAAAIALGLSTNSCTIAEGAGGAPSDDGIAEGAGAPSLDGDGHLAGQIDKLHRRLAIARPAIAVRT